MHYRLAQTRHSIMSLSKVSLKDFEKLYQNVIWHHSLLKAVFVIINGSTYNHIKPKQLEALRAYMYSTFKTLAVSQIWGEIAFTYTVTVLSRILAQNQGMTYRCFTTPNPLIYIIGCGATFT